MKNFENELRKLDEAISHKPWYDDVVVFDIGDDLCMDISDCREWEADIKDCLNTLLRNEGVKVTAMGEDDYFYCEYCNKYHWVNNGAKSNMVVIGDYNTVCRICLSWAEKEDPELADEYFEYLIDNHLAANEFLTDGYLQDKGFVPVDNEFCGMYVHDSDDTPEEVLLGYMVNGFDVIFNIRNIDPEVNFTVYVREME